MREWESKMNKSEREDTVELRLDGLWLKGQALVLVEYNYHYVIT